MSSSKVVLKILSVCFSLLIFIVIVFGLCRIGLFAFDMGYRVFTEKPMAGSSKGRDVVVEVEADMSALKLGQTLEEKGLVDSAYLFVLQMELSAYAKTVKPGLYTLSTSQTAREMLRVMSGDKEAGGDDGTGSSKNTNDNDTKSAGDGTAAGGAGEADDGTAAPDGSGNGGTGTE